MSYASYQEIEIRSVLELNTLTLLTDRLRHLSNPQ